MSTCTLISHRSGTKEWIYNGLLHRTDGPAFEAANGTKEWWVNGTLHRIDGPAAEDSEGSKYWYINGLLHCEDGPAVEYADGSKYWYINGVELTEEEHARQTQRPHKLIASAGQSISQDGIWEVRFSALQAVIDDQLAEATTLLEFAKRNHLNITPALRDVAQLYEKYDKLYKLHEQAEPSPVSPTDNPIDTSVLLSVYPDDDTIYQVFCADHLIDLSYNQASTSTDIQIKFNNPQVMQAVAQAMLQAVDCFTQSKKS